MSVMPAAPIVDTLDRGEIVTVPSRSRVSTAAQISGLLIVTMIAFALAREFATNDSVARAGGADPAIQEQNEVGSTSISSYPAIQNKSDLRVSLLGITKGVAFLKSQEPAADDGREHGENAVPWVQVSVLVEMLGNNPAPLGRYSYELQSSEGEELVDKIQHELTVKGVPVLITGRSSGIAEADVNDSIFWRRLFPVSLRNVENPEQAKVFQITMSGQIQDTPTTTLVLDFRIDGDQERFVFANIPQP